MPPYGEPDWVTPGNTSNTVTQKAGTSIAAPPSTMSNSNGGRSGGGKGSCILVLMSLANMGVAAAMGALGVLTLVRFDAGSASANFSVSFLSIYMIIFACILFLYELCWWQSFPKINKTFRRNVGFMYGIRGKGFYLIFMAFLCMGLHDAWGDDSAVRTLDWTAGLGWLGMGCFHVFVACWWPEISNQYKPPTAGLTSDEMSYSGNGAPPTGGASPNPV